MTSQRFASKTPLAKPSWLKVRAPVSQEYHETYDLIRENNLNTVCEEAACPNIGTCWKKKHATIMILGSTCSRACAFCNIKTGRPDLLDPHEPERVGKTLANLGLHHVVVTSVDRDDLPDGGATHFAQTIAQIRLHAPGTTIEVLTPDFQRTLGAEEIVFKANPDVFNHNLETVPRLYAQVRPGARYFHSLKILSRCKERFPHIFTKSGLMVGLGETKQELYQVMDDLRCAGVDFITLGQYLQPTPRHHPVERFVPPEEFEDYAHMARGKGFLMVSASPLTRSSFHAGEDFAELKKNRQNQAQKRAQS